MQRLLMQRCFRDREFFRWEYILFHMHFDESAFTNAFISYTINNK